MSKLFLMGAFGLMSLTVSAADLIERTAPEAPSTVPAFYNGDLSLDDLEMTPASFQVGKMYVLYNVTEQTFFSQGCAWATQAATSSSVPLAVSFYLPEGKTLADATLLMRDYNLYTNAWNNVFFDSETALFTDRGSQANIYFQVIDKGSKTYRIQASEANPSLKPSAYSGFVGRDETVTYSGDFNGRTAKVADTSAQPISPFLAEGQGHHIDWQFFELPQLSDWEEYFQLLEVFNKSEELKTTIAKAEEAGLTAQAVADGVSVYNNSNATLEQLQKAIDDINNAYFNAPDGTATDVSYLITNYDYDNNSNEGWSGDQPAFQSYTDAEFYNKDFEYYQDLEALKGGVYALGVKGFYRAGGAAESYEAYQQGTGQNAIFYATVGGTTSEKPLVNICDGGWGSKVGTGAEVSAGPLFVPNNMQAAEAYFQAGRYTNTILLDVADGSEMTIGLKKNVHIDNEWTIWDTWTLFYYGNGAAAYQGFVNHYKKTVFPDFTLDRVPAEDPFTNTSGSNYTLSYKEAFDAASPTATDKASADAAMEVLNTAFNNLKNNVQLWAEFLALAKRAAIEVGDNQTLIQEDALVAEVGDWGKYLASEDWNAQEMTNEELRAIIDEMTEKIAEAKLRIKHEGYETVVTNLLTNPEFTGNATGWTDEHVGGGNVRYGENCYEAWNNSNFDIYQVVKNAPEGVYRIEVQGFYRYGRGHYSDYYEQNNEYVKPGGAPVFVYMNHKKTPFTNIYGDAKQISDASFYAGTGYEDLAVNEDGSIATDVTEDTKHLYFPNDMASAAKAFSAQMYKQSAYGIIRAGQEMRIGVKGNSTQLGDSWVIWDNFNLFNCGKDATALNNVLPEEIENAQKLLLDDNGQPKLMGKEIKEGLEKAIADAQAALGTTGEAMFDALNDLFDAEENVDESVALFKQLEAANDKLMNAIENNQDSPVLEEAQALYEEIVTALGGYEYSDSDVADKLAEITKMLTKFRLPSEEEYKDASPMNPVDFTQVIENPGYEIEDEGTPLADGWLGTGVDTNATGLNAQVFNNTFDHYQEFYGMPAGQYEVSVLGFYRYGGNGPTYDYAAWNEDPTANNNALLYANNQSVALKRLAEFADGEHAGEDDWAEVEAESGLYVPNMMPTAGTLFMEKGDALRNKVTAIVGADGYLRIGLKKDVAVANDWTIFDSWQLWYLGASLPGDVNGDGAVDVADISAIISDMAAGTNAPSADVNGDGAVDVADISAVITIMAENARLAKAIEE